jgi:hypothetical protein
VTVLNLIITSFITAYTYRSGALEILITPQTLQEYLVELIIPEFQEKEMDNLAMLKATCIKFVYMFRNQLPEELIPDFVQKISEFLQSEHLVNQSYAAACIEKLLMKRT